MKNKHPLIMVVLGFAVMFLPSTAAAKYISVYTGPDAEWNYLYDFGDVEVGSSGVMIFQIENAPSSPDSLILESVYIEEAGPFTITYGPAFTADIAPDESVYVEVTFMLGAEGLFEKVMRIISNASNIPPGTDIPCALRGMGTAPPPDFIAGPAVSTLNSMLLDGLDALGY